MKLFNISFGFFGVQIAYALQSANISRIFSTLGADPHNLSYFWILPPLMGIIVQPFVGAWSDCTWTRFGRRIPYLFVGALVAVLVMCMLPNAGSFGMAAGTAMAFGLLSLMFLDTSINMAMQPFKMMVGDMVNEKQKGLAYSIQSFLCNAGSLAGYLFPFIFAAIGISNVAPEGVIPDSVIYSFYIGAAILILCVIYTTAKVKEYPPEEYNEYHPTDPSPVSPRGEADTLPLAKDTTPPLGEVREGSGSGSALIINCFGKLSSIYRYGKVALVGGGFGVGIHNVPEAAVYGIPVLFGPNNQTFREAQALKACRGSDNFINNPEALKQAGEAAGNYINANAGAADKCFTAIFKK